MGVLWIGHEADCYILGDASNFEANDQSDAGYERAGMVTGATGSLTSTPDWPATDEIWQRFNAGAGSSLLTNVSVWGARNAAGQEVARIWLVTATSAQFQVWNGSAFVNVGAAFATSNTKKRYDIHFKAGAAGQVEVWHGSPGSQTKVVDETGNYSAAGGIVRIWHDAIRSAASGFRSAVAHEVVQTFSTLSSASETKPPTSNGTDTDGTGTFADVDEQVYSDVDYVSFSAAGQHKSFKAAARTLTQAVVTGVTASCRALYEAGGPTKIKPYLLIGGTRYYGTTFNLALTMQAYQYTWTTNPATGVAFTPAEANAATLEWGWEAVA